MLSHAPLRAALDALYAAFAAYPAPTEWEVAPGRPTSLLQRLTGTPLRQLTCEDLGSYSGWAMTTVGEPIHYKHFLPRIAELAVQGDCPHQGTIAPILAGKIIYAAVDRWPAAEQQAARAFFRTAFEQAISEHPDHADAEDWLCANLRLGADLADTLQIWTVALPNATLQLAQSVQSARYNGHDLPPFWDEHPAEHRAAFDAWLRRPAARLALEAALSDAGEDEWLIRKALEATRLQ